MESSEASMARVIGDDDLLREILLRLGVPSSLVRAALVSKRWLGVAAHRAFLRRFRDRHPPQLIGFYINDPATAPRPRFVRVSEVPGAELHPAGFHDGDPFLGILDCRNGRLLLKLGAFTYGGYVMRNLLSPTRALVPVLPPPVSLPSIDRFRSYLTAPDSYSQRNIFLSRDSSSNGIVYVALLLVGRKLSVEVRASHPSGAWGRRVLPAVELPALSNPVMDVTMPVHGNLYMVATNARYIHCWDFVAPQPRFCTVKLPGEVSKNFKLSYGDDNGLILIHGEGFQLSVWHLTDDSVEDGWKLVDRFRVLAAEDRGEEILVVGAGDEAKSVFLWLKTSGAIVCVNLRNKHETVYEVMVRSTFSISVFPYMTVWPPIFPALDYENDRGK